MQNLTIITKLIPLGLTALWISGAIAIIRNVFQRKSWSDILLSLLAIGIASVFILECMTVFNFAKSLLDSVSGIISAFDLKSLMK